MHSPHPALAAMLAQQPLSPASHKDCAPPSHLYLHQQRTVEVIQLIEVPAPPPRSHPCTSTIYSSSFASSSSSSSSDEDSEEDESVCSSYCSSEEDEAAEQASSYDDTYNTRLNRVLAWRDAFVKASAPLADMNVPSAPPSSPISSSPAPSLKRKADDDADLTFDDDTSSQSSKRSRSLPPQPERTPPPFQQRRLSAHSCSACDACFNTLQSLRQHGKDSGPNEACREAVEYGFEP